MLLKHGDLRSCLIHLAGHGRLTIVTKAPEKAGQRISRYLLMQSLINGSFGVAVGLGLFLIGVPYAILWGFLPAALRVYPVRRFRGVDDPPERPQPGRVPWVGAAFPVLSVRSGPWSWAFRLVAEC